MNYDYCNGTIYVIKKGDTLYSISRKYNVPLAMILRANPYADVYNLKVGDEICVPQQHMAPVTKAPSVSGENGMENGDIENPVKPEMGPGPVMPDMDRPEMGPGPVMPDMDRPEMGPGPVRPNPPQQYVPKCPVTGRAFTYSEMAEKVRMMTADSQIEPITLFTPARNQVPRNTGGKTTLKTGKTLWTSKKAQNTLEEEAAMDGVQGMEINGATNNVPMNNSGNMTKPDLSKDATISYVVRNGDTLSDVLGYFSMTLQEFFLYNRMERLFLKEGMIISIPSSMDEEV